MNRWISVLPTWLRVVLIAVLFVAGGLMIGRPFDAIELLVASFGIAAIAAGLGSVFADRDRGFAITGIAIVAILIGLGCLWFRDTAIAVLPIVIAGFLIAMGLRRLWSVATRRTAHPLYTLMSGLGWSSFGVAAFLWPDVTLLVLGLTIGPVLVGIGASVLQRLWRNRRRQPATESVLPEGGRPGLLRTGGAILSAMLGIAIIATTISLDRAVPRAGAFYDAPDSLPDTPGQLLKQETFTRNMPDRSRALLILYTTPNIDGVTMGVGSALVIVPEAPAADPVPVILWAHGTTGVNQACAPSLAEAPLGDEAMPGEQQVIDNGWAIVAPDYIGLGTEGPHPYLVGVPTARSSLDALRAAHQIPELSLSDQTAVWGHSQGGGAALWIGIESLTYAPELDIIGIAALSPATDLPNLAGHLVSTTFGRVFGSFMLTGYENYYDDVEMRDYIRPAARVAYEAMAHRCLQDNSSLVSILVAMADDDAFQQNPTDGPLADHLAENVPVVVTGLPTFIGQGINDQVIDIDIQREYVATACGNGQVIEYHEYPDQDHLSVVKNDSPLVPELLAWTTARFNGDPATTSCQSNAPQSSD